MKRSDKLLISLIILLLLAIIITFIVFYSKVAIGGHIVLVSGAALLNLLKKE